MSSSPDRSALLRRLLDAGHEPTYDDLLVQLDLSSTRHVRRLLADLREGGVPVRERRDGRLKRFYLAPEDRRVDDHATFAFDEREVFALTVAAQASHSALAPTPLGGPLQRAFDKLLGGLEDAVYSFEPAFEQAHWYFEHTTASNLDPVVFEAVTRAVREGQAIRIDYLAAYSGHTSRRRLVDPYLVAVRGTSWLLVAYCHSSQRLLDFSLAGISKVEPADRYFSRPADFDPELHFRDRFSALQGDEVHVVRLEVEAAKAPYFQRKTYHPTQQVEEERPDGGLVVSFEVSGLDEIAAFIRSWGPGVVVTSPPALAERLRAEAQAVAAAYGVDTQTSAP